jgi:hypothetical protein
MNSAFGQEHLDRRSLGLSIAIHLLLVALLLIGWRHRQSEAAAPPYVPPQLTLDMPLPPQEQVPVPLKIQSTHAQDSRVKQPVAAVVNATIPKPAAPAAEPVVEPQVQPLVQMPALNPVAGAPAIGPGVGSGDSSSNGASAGSGGGGSDGQGGDATAERPDWIDKPTSDERLMVLSPSAVRDHANGWAVLSCFVAPWKGVRKCKVVGESADSSGHHPYAFGKSALELSQYFRVRPPMRNGRPRYDIPVRIPVYWTWD